MAPGLTRPRSVRPSACRHRVCGHAWPASSSGCGWTSTMSDQQRFEARFEAAYGRYLEGAPVAVDAKALTRAITAASPRPGARQLLTVNNVLRLVLLVALVGTAILAVSLSTDQNVLPQSGCGTPLPITSTPGPSRAFQSDTADHSPVEFLWSATGPADDPMKFDTADQMDGAAEAGAIAVDR